MFGPQVPSKRATAPSYGFSTAGREVTSKLFMEPERPGKVQIDHSIPPQAALKKEPVKSITYWNFAQLEQTERKLLRGKALTLLDLCTAEGKAASLRPIPHDQRGIILWILDTQVALTQGSSRPKALRDFGYVGPAEEEKGKMYFGQDFGQKYLRPEACEGAAAAPEGAASVEAEGDALQTFMAGREAQAAAKQRALAGGNNIFPGENFPTPPAELEKAAKYAAAKAAAAMEAASRRAAEAKREARVRKNRARNGR